MTYNPNWGDEGATFQASQNNSLVSFGYNPNWGDYSEEEKKYREEVNKIREKQQKQKEIIDRYNKFEQDQIKKRGGMFKRGSVAFWQTLKDGASGYKDNVLHPIRNAKEAIEGTKENYDKIKDIAKNTDAYKTVQDINESRSLEYQQEAREKLAALMNAKDIEDPIERQKAFIEGQKTLDDLMARRKKAGDLPKDFITGTGGTIKGTAETIFPAAKRSYEDIYNTIQITGANPFTLGKAYKYDLEQVAQGKMTKEELEEKYPLLKKSYGQVVGDFVGFGLEATTLGRAKGLLGGAKAAAPIKSFQYAKLASNPAAKLTGKAAAKHFAKRTAEFSGLGGGFMGAEKMSAGGTPQEIAKATGLGAVGGALLYGAGRGIGTGYKGLRNYIKGGGKGLGTAEKEATKIVGEQAPKSEVPDSLLDDMFGTTAGKDAPKSYIHLNKKNVYAEVPSGVAKKLYNEPERIISSASDTVHLTPKTSFNPSKNQTKVKLSELFDKSPNAKKSVDDVLAEIKEETAKIVSKKSETITPIMVREIKTGDRIYRNKANVFRVKISRNKGQEIIELVNSQGNAKRISPTDLFGAKLVRRKEIEPAYSLLDDLGRKKATTTKPATESIYKEPYPSSKTAEVVPEQPKKQGILDRMFNRSAESKTQVKKYQTEMAVGKAKAAEEAANLNIPESSGNIFKHQSGQQYKGRKQVEDTFERLFQKARQFGEKIKRAKNYLPQYWKEDTKTVQQAVARKMKDRGATPRQIADYLAGKELAPSVSKKLKMSPSFAEHRYFTSYKEGAKYGLTPKYENIKQLAGAYEQELNTVIANKNLVKNLKTEGIISYAELPGTSKVNVPGIKKTVYASKNDAKFINDYFRDEGTLDALHWTNKKFSQVSKKLQNIVLAGGFPKTNLNFFTFGHVIKGLTGAAGELTTLNLKGAAREAYTTMANFIRSNFTKPSIKYFEKRIKNGMYRRMAEEGIDMSNVVGNFRENNRGFLKFWKNTEKSKWLPEGYNKLLEEKTFNSFIPMQYTSVFEGTYNAAIKKGMGKKAAQKLAGKTTKMYMGIPEGVAGKTMEDLKSAMLFAPQFRESLIKTYGNTLMSLSPHTWTNKAYAKNRKLAVGMAVTFFGGFDLLNKKLNGHHMWENPKGKELELMIPGKDGKVYYVPFMPSQLAFFRNIFEAGVAAKEGDVREVTRKVSSNMSMSINLFGSLLGNKDYFGNEIYDNQAPPKEMAKDIAKYVGMNANHPYVKGMIQMVINANASKNPFYSKYLEIAELSDKGDRDGANDLIDALSEEDKQAYYDLKSERIKPLPQVMSEMTEMPIRYTTEGKIESSKFYQKADKIIREIKKVPEGTERTEKIQEIIDGLPEKEKSGIIGQLYNNGINTKGVRYKTYYKQ